MRLADEHVKMLGHHNIAEHVEFKLSPDLFANLFEDRPRSWRLESPLPAVTATSDEMQVSFAVDADESRRHWREILSEGAGAPHFGPPYAARRMGHPL